MFNNTNTPLPDFGDPYHNTDIPRTGNRWPRRLLLFSLVFLPLTLILQIYIFLQPAIYSSKATLLTVALPDIDAVEAKADPQHVTIQKQILLGQSLLGQVASILNRQVGIDGLNAEQLKTMLFVDPVKDTNLVELSAEGPVPETLQRIVNTWTKTYLDVRATNISENTGQATEAIRDEIGRIEQAVEFKRKQLDDFRIKNNISSAESEDNPAHARLQGLNRSMSTALEEEVKAKAKLETIRAALAQGKAVVPDQDSQSLAEMNKRAQTLKEQANTIKSQYTSQYIQLNPKLKLVTKELIDLEQRIREKVKIGGVFALQEAENNYQSAKQTVKAIKEQMHAHQKETSSFTTQFSKFRGLQEELVKLEELQQKTKQRLIEIEVKQREAYPQVEVVDWAALPLKSIRPNYLQQSLIALAAVFSLSLLAVWLREFLSKEGISAQQPPLVNISGIHVYPHQDRLIANPTLQTALGLPQHAGQLAHDPSNLLTATTRELSPQEIQGLFNVADQRTTEILCLLLNGLSAEEITQMTPGSFDFKNNTIHLPNRDVGMNRFTQALFTAEPKQRWQTTPFSLEDINGLLTCAAIDSRLQAPEQINTDLVRFTYMAYLVKQGIRFSLLPRIFGSITSSRLIELGQFAPVHSSASLEEVNLDYPLINSYRPL